VNFATLQTAVLDRLGVPASDALFTAAVLGRAVNEAVQEIKSEHDWPWDEASETITTVAGTDTYSVAADWMRTQELKPSADYPLERRSIIDIDSEWPFGDTGRPQVYAINKGQIVLRPIPAQVDTITHRYIKTQADLTGTDTPALPAQFHTAIVELATYIALKRSRDDARGAAALDAYQRWISKMHRWRRRHTGPGRIRSRWD
jgi:hypothetical protein